MPDKRRGTRPYVRSAPHAKLQPDQIREIIKRVKAGEKKAAVARAMNLGRKTVWRVLDEYAPELIKRGAKE